MSLLIYNMTATPQALANGLGTSIPASTAGAGVRGEPWYASGNEMQGRSGAEYLAMQAQQDAGDFQFVWEKSPEYPTPGLTVASAAGDQTSVDLEVYVNGSTGSDSNPGTASAPLLTWDAAWAKIKPGTRKRRLYVQGSTLDIAVPSAKDYNVPSPIINGEPLVVIGDNTLLESGTIAALSGSNGRIFSRVTPATPRPGASLVFTSGPAAGVRVTIAFDDGTNIYLVYRPEVGGSSTPPVVGNTFNIEEPASILNLTGPGFMRFVGGQMAFKNIKFQGVGLQTVDFVNCQVQASENVLFDTETLAVEFLDGTIFKTVGDPNPFLSPNPYSFTLRRNCGVTFKGITGNGIVRVRGGGAQLGQGAVGLTLGAGAVVLLTTQMIVDNGGVFASNPAPCGKDSQISANEGGKININSPQATVRGVMDGSLVSGFPPLNAGPATTGQGGPSEVSLRRFTVNNAVGSSGISIKGASQCAADTCRGAGNAAYGVRLDGASVMGVVSSTPGTPAGNTTVTTVGVGGGAPATTTITDNPLTAAAVTVNVVSTAGFPAAGTIRVENGGIRELIDYTGVTATSFTGCTRGAQDTFGQSAALGTTVTQASGVDTIIGATPKTYAAMNGAPGGFSDGIGNTFSIRQGGN